MRAERMRIFIGCEGESEQAYVACLHRLAETQGRRVHLDGRVLREGDPLSRIEYAARLIDKLERQRGGYAHRFALLDFDQVERDPERQRRATQIADDANIAIIWQRPAHEALLLAHFADAPARQFATPAEALAQLVRIWPGYAKNLPSPKYCEHIGLEGVRLAAHQDHALTDLLTLAGLIA